MLVLSRREDEKVLFPALGIAVEVTRVQGKTVRLGIDAPNEIRIVRGELDQFESGNFVSKGPSLNFDQTRIQRCLDAANLAIHLASNQLKQELNEKAELALENALQCLEELELAAVGHSPAASETSAVREAGTKYRVSAKPTCPIAAIISSQENLRSRLAELLTQKGFQVIEFAEEISLLKYVQSYEQPAVVLAESTSQTLGKLIRAIEDDDQEIELRISGIAGLRKNRISFLIEDSKPVRASNGNISTSENSQSDPRVPFTGWFDDSEIALEIESLLQSS